MQPWFIEILGGIGRGGKLNKKAGLLRAGGDALREVKLALSG